MTIAISTAIASNTEASTPTALSMSQLRAICDPTATRTARRRRSAAQVPQHGEAAAEPRAPAGRRLPQPGEHQQRHRQEHERQPPRQPQRTHERERGQRRERRLDGEDRDLGGDQRRHARALVRCRAAQGGDPRRRADRAVELAAQVAQARRAEQAAPADGAARRDDADPPRLRPRHERQQLQRGGGDQDPDGRGAERRAELVPAIGEDVDQHSGHRERSGDRDQRAPPLRSRHCPTPDDVVAEFRMA